MNTHLVRFPGIDILTMDNIMEWAGEKVTKRGVRYQKNSMVTNLVITEDKVILADVLGSHMYSVAVYTNEDGELESHCSCPYEWDCKHGVAALLQYITCLKTEKDIPLATETDLRIRLLDDDFNGDFDDDDDANRENLPHIAGLSPALKTYLAGLSREALLNEIYKLMLNIPQVKVFLENTVTQVTDDTSRMLKKLNKAIADAHGAVGDPWSEYSSIDYSAVRDMMQLFLDAHKYDELFSCTYQFLQDGQKVVEMYDHDGDLGSEVANCLTFCCEALRASSLSPHEKLIQALELVLQSDFGLADDFDTYLKEVQDIKAWNELVAHIAHKIEKAPQNISGYTRRELSEWYKFALERADRSHEILSFCEKEAHLTQDYVPLVRRCIHEKKYDEALHWICVGLKKQSSAAWHIKSNLCELKQDVYTLQEDWTSLLPLKVEGFLFRPSATTYLNCQKIAEKLSLWAPVRESLLSFLIDGTLPWKHSTWPTLLTPPQLLEKMQKPTEPDLYNLVKIAIAENNVDDVNKWYRMIPKGKGYDEMFYENIAKVVQEKYPEVSISLWKKLAENTIAQVSVNLYPTAVNYLQNLERCMCRHNMQADWDNYILAIRKQHARKKRFIEELNARNKPTQPLLSKE